MNASEAKEQFERTYGAARLNLEGVEDEQALRTPGEAGNSINWITGHVVAYRGQLLSALGAEPPAEETSMGLYRSGGEWTPERALSLERLVGLLGASQEALSATFEGEAAPETSRAGEVDLAFFHFHEAYHVGQLGLARRCLGLSGAIDPSDAPGGS